MLIPDMIGQFAITAIAALLLSNSIMYLYYSGEILIAMSPYVLV